MCSIVVELGDHHTGRARIDQSGRMELYFTDIHTEPNETLHMHCSVEDAQKLAKAIEHICSYSPSQS